LKAWSNGNCFKLLHWSDVIPVDTNPSSPYAAAGLLGPAGIDGDPGGIPLYIMGLNSRGKRAAIPVGSIGVDRADGCDPRHGHPGGSGGCQRGWCGSGRHHRVRRDGWVPVPNP